ncbi:MAG: hypothetical protein U5R31_17655 [Acidimicrobiia bacterium]|nr:hypothetical protein [Acidimicrobiia bacterium]
MFPTPCGRDRAEAPVAWCETEGFEPFWAITKHADICEISRQPDRFSSEPGIVVLHESQQRDLDSGESPFSGIKQIINMDPPDHRDYRKVASPVFTPRGVTGLDEAIDESARRVVDRVGLAMTGEGECDFANDVAAAHPLRILATMLGISEEARARHPAADQRCSSLSTIRTCNALETTATRRSWGWPRSSSSIFDQGDPGPLANPTDDLASLLANAWRSAAAPWA